MWSFGFHGASVQGSYVLPCCPEPQFFRFEGVWLTETGMAVLRNLTMSPLHKRRQRRGRLGLPGEAGLEVLSPQMPLALMTRRMGTWTLTICSRVKVGLGNLRERQIAGETAHKSWDVG